MTGLDGIEIAHHVKYLWDEKLITGDDATNLQSPSRNHDLGHHACGS